MSDLVRRLAPVLVLLLLFTGCAPRLLTNGAGEQRMCKVENVTDSVYVCYGQACGALGAVALLFALAAAATYQACIQQAHEEGFE